MRLGVGDALDTVDVDSTKLASAVTEQLSDGGVRERIKAVRATLGCLPGPDEVAVHLTRVAG